MTTQSSGEGTINQIYCANRSDDSSFTSKVTQHVLIFEISSTSLYAEHHVLSIMALAFYLFFFCIERYFWYCGCVCNKTVTFDYVKLKSGKKINIDIVISHSEK